LTIIGADGIDVTITVNGDSTFESTSGSGSGSGIGGDSGMAVGIRVSNAINLTVAGSATLTAAGSSSVGCGLDVGAGTLTIGENLIDGGALIAQGGMRAINWATADKTPYEPGGAEQQGPHGSLYGWRWSQNYDGSGESKAPSTEGGDHDYGFSDEEEFEYYRTDHYVMLRAVTPVELVNAVQVGGISGQADSVAVTLSLSRPVIGLTMDDVVITNGTGRVEIGAFTGSGDTWLLMLDSVLPEGAISVKVNSFGGYYISRGLISGVEVYKAAPPPPPLPPGYPYPGVPGSGDNDDKGGSDKDDNGDARDNEDGEDGDGDSNKSDSDSSGEGDNGSGGKTYSWQYAAGEPHAMSSVFVTDHLAYITGYPDGRIEPNGRVSCGEGVSVLFWMFGEDVREV
jgi:hypothetical protein